MGDEKTLAQAAVVDLWNQLDEMQRQSLITLVARAVAAGATAQDVQEWLDTLMYEGG